jgi:hypothetical protein
MVTKFNYYIDAIGLVARNTDYSFTAIEELGSRLSGIDSENVISSIAATTLKGESERSIIEVEDEWFKVQSKIQDMDAERVTLETRLASGDKNGNPLTPDMQNNISARIAECKEGTIVIKKEFYNHYTRETSVVDEVTQTPYTIALETRIDLEASNKYLTGLRGVSGAPARPVAKLDTAKETEIRKELVRQKIDATVGDDKDLIADMSNALSAIIKKVAGQTVSADEETAIAQYVSRQAEIASIMAADYKR